MGVGSRRDDPEAPARIASEAAFRDWPLIVVSDDAVRAASGVTSFLWTTFTRFEPAADISAAATRIVRNHVSYSAPVVIDARLKEGFPEELSADEETAARVSRRWKEYFPAGQEMGDADKGHLD